ncbi:MAG TPA: hypothetical protein VJJ82_01980 [Candidatus Nanoarchaeia archaeon]|nr:hypothetical protein [Candidatus Nanoarchaeia archaeon]
MNELDLINQKVASLKNGEMAFRSSDQLLLILVVNELQRLNKTLEGIKAQLGKQEKIAL